MTNTAAYFHEKRFAGRWKHCERMLREVRNDLPRHVLVQETDRAHNDLDLLRDERLSVVELLLLRLAQCEPILSLIVHTTCEQLHIVRQEGGKLRRRHIGILRHRLAPVRREAGGEAPRIPYQLRVAGVLLVKLKRQRIANRRMSAA